MFFRILKYSFIKLIKTPSVWVFFVVNLFLSLLAAIILPLCNKNIAEYISFDSHYSLILLGILSLHSSMIGESNADPIERVFILARPIKRTTYLWSKIISTFILTTFLAVCIMATWAISAGFITDRAFQGLNPRNPSNQINFNYEGIAFLAIFLVATFAGAFGTIYRLYMKNKISSIIAMVFVMAIYMIYTITFSTSIEPLNNQQIMDYYYIKYIGFPLVIVAVSVGLILFGFRLNRKEDIRI